ncbi:MAG TPA: molybdate ABC transporter substrate-binding protein [Ornithinibacter sp.]|nr:molybdate ABC transporter substrate-binding protein [Ornithinibacter sp.]
MRPALARLTAGLLTASVLGACAATAGSDAGSDGDTGDRTLTVLAASSLTDPLTTLARTYEDDHPGVRVRLSFGSSTKLAQQVAQGAPADLVVLAGTAVLEQLPETARDPARRTTVARNVLEIATPPSDPAGVSSLADLANVEADVVLCVETAPCGRAADEVLERAGVMANVVSREIDVRSTLAKIVLGEADAAIVYHSDVVTAGTRVRGVPIPAGANTTLEYPLVRLTDRADTTGFADLVAGDAGRQALTDAGFLTP